MRTWMLSTMLVLAQTVLAQKPPPIDMKSCDKGYRHTGTACGGCGKYTGAVLICPVAGANELRQVELVMPQVFANKDKAKVRVRIRRVAGGQGSRFKVKELVRNVEGSPPAATQFGFLLQTTDGTKPEENYYMEYRIKGR